MRRESPHRPWPDRIFVREFECAGRATIGPGLAIFKRGFVCVGRAACHDFFGCYEPIELSGPRRMILVTIGLADGRESGRWSNCRSEILTASRRNRFLPHLPDGTVSGRCGNRALQTASAHALQRQRRDGSECSLPKICSRFVFLRFPVDSTFPVLVF